MEADLCVGLGARILAAMHLTTLDWAVIAITLVVCFAPSLLFGKRAGKNTSEFFVSGRTVPWWLAGFSMVATTFSSDTPNLVTDIVRRNGVAGNWVWWAFVLTGVAAIAPKGERIELVRTRVHVLPLTMDDIQWYVGTGEPEGKAGAYAIQGRAARFVDWIEGSWSNVVGLPVATVARMLRELG